jgi:dipeptidyl aminopeptidase/acylaminoacyl peptidase
LPSLRDLLEVRWALPADVAADGTVLVRWNRTGTMQLYLARPGSGELEQLSDFAEPVQGWFVPGSERILLSMDAGGNERGQLYLLDARAGAEPEPLVVEPEFLHVEPHLSRDGTLLAYGSNRRNGRDVDVYVRSLATGEERSVFAPGGYCAPVGFSPDGRTLAAVRLTDRTGDNDLHLVDVQTGADVLVAPDEEDAYFGAPAWLADGSAFYFATSSGRDTAAIARFDVADGDWEYVLEDDWDLECRTDRDGRHLVVDANDEGASRVRVLDAGSLELVRDLELPGRGVVDPFALSPDGSMLALGYSSPRIPWSVLVVDVATGSTRRLSTAGDAVREEELVEPTLHRFSSFDGESVPLWLFEPEDGDGKAPVVVEIHGGPESQRRPMWIPLVQYLVAGGYAVAMPNVRGSVGYGKRYEHLDDGRRRLDSVRDLVALHDWLRADGRFDAARTVLYGGSYGGYMVLAGLAFHPERWAAGIAVVPVSSFVTFLENTSAYRRSIREREYGSLEADRDFLVEASPLTHVDRIAAPLFLIHGANDPRVPLSEAEQIHAALRARGIPSELLVYEDEGHGLNKLRNRLDAYPRAVAWLEGVLAGEQDEQENRGDADLRQRGDGRRERDQEEERADEREQRSVGEEQLAGGGGQPGRAPGEEG